jgi:hypothetical protein
MYSSFAQEWKARCGIMVINNKDNLCLPRAIVVIHLLRMILKFKQSVKVGVSDKLLELKS